MWCRRISVRQKIEGAEEFLRDTCYENAKAMYGDPIPEVIQTRLDTD